MEFGPWLAFASACFVLSVFPGPSVLVVTGQAISKGSRAARICVIGEILGGVCLVFLSLLGVGQIVAASPLVFQALKWAGVTYLIFLGLKEVIGARHIMAGAEGTPVSKGSFGARFWTSLCNPKSLVFYLAFLTQFVNMNAPLAVQYVTLIVTAATVAAVVLSAYALFATSLRHFISSSGSRRKFSRLSGLFYIAGAALVAVVR